MTEITTKKKTVVYVASHYRFADFWKELADDSGPYEIISTWFRLAQPVVDPGAVAKLWENCFHEIRQADILVARVEPGDTLKGVLVEIGAALVLGMPVYLLLESFYLMGCMFELSAYSLPLGDIWQHPDFFQVPSLRRAVEHYTNFFKEG